MALFNSTELFGTSSTGKDCVWLISINYSATNNSSTRLRLTFTEFLFEGSNAYSIGNGLDPGNSSTRVMKRNGQAMHKTLISDGHEIWITTSVVDDINQARYTFTVETFTEVGKKDRMMKVPLVSVTFV